MLQLSSCQQAHLAPIISLMSMKIYANMARMEYHLR